ncbi:MAG: peptide-methionine (S)-S-oxide reductase MsrA [Bacteroidales bacterium]|jgi:peptide methionine sulfoxide reductase msrA/msrB|nr:peptide-methionine (S)-S-oxide reductase MsrA [Bacteroidales bacterium]
MKAYFASGCFWGTEYHFSKAKGVIETTVGYMGGYTENPTYKDVCSGATGHIETIEVVYDPEQTTYEELLKLYFETHNFEQEGGQGPDIGEQYISVIFYINNTQKELAAEYIQILQKMGYSPATELRPVGRFYPAEDYHQDYYEKSNSSPYCHIYRKIFK